MNIDIETILREELRNILREHLNMSASMEAYKIVDKAINRPAIFQTEESKYEYEFPREGKTRRNAEEMALHKEEKLLERRLTPEEKGEIKAKLHIDDSTENTAKEAAIKKARIDKIAAEGMAAASKELAEETKEQHNIVTRVQEGMDKHDLEKEVEEKIPEVSSDNLSMVNPSLFTNNDK